MADLDVLIPEGYDLIVLRWLLPSGRTATCNIGAQPNTANTLQARADFAYNATVAEWDQITDTNYSFVPTIVYHNTGSGVTSAIAAGANAPGTASKATAPCELNIGIRKRTGFIGKGFRGRMYWPIGLNEASVDEGGLIIASTITAVENALDAWGGELFGTSEPFVNPALFRNPNPSNPDTPRVQVPITSFDVSPVCTSQRRRRTRV